MPLTSTELIKDKIKVKFIHLIQNTFIAAVITMLNR